MYDTLLSLLDADNRIVEVFLIVFVTLLVAWLASKLFDRLARQAERTQNMWDDTLVHAARQPGVLLILLEGLSWAAQIAGAESGSKLVEIIPEIRTLGAIALFAIFALRGIRFVEQNVITDEYLEEPVDVTTAAAIGKLLRISVVITALLTAAQSQGVEVAGLLAFGGVGGIAVGFAARDLLANFFGGLMIYLDRPFSVGDWIRSPDRSIEGTVEEIGWRQTRIRTFDARPLYVPNSAFSTIAVENPSRMTNRRIKETIGVRYDDIAVVEAITRDVREMLAAHEAIDTSRTLMVNFDAFGPSSLDFFIYTFTRTTVWTEFHAIKQDVLLRIAEIIERHGAEIAFPTRTLHMVGPEPEPDPEPEAAATGVGER